MYLSKENSCRICKKVFCCSDCRDNHENSKHPKPKCSLCTKEAFPFKPDSKEDSLKNSELICHVVFNHLPLRCKLCGEKFKKNTDLLEAQPCRWWSERRKYSIKVIEEKLPLTPQQSVQPIELNKSLRSIDTSSIIRLKQENFDSPPELARHTSTPVHHPSLPLPGQKPQLGAIGIIPQFSLKTPSSFDQRNSLSGTASSSDFESRYFTGNSQLLSAGKHNNNNNNKDHDRNQSVDPSWNSMTFSILKKQLDPLNAVKSGGLDSIEKRVRFSDQCIVSTPPMGDTSSYYADNEIFFEARESLDDEESNTNNNNDNDIKKKESLQVLKSNSSSEAEKSEACSCYRQSNDSSEKKVTDSNMETSTESKPNSSRVVMMLLVENTDSSKSLSSVDFAPLINSGLKKLEETAANKITVEVTEKKTVIQDSIVKNNEKPQAVIETREESKHEEVSLQVQDSISNNSYKSDGIFSVVARVVRSALMKLPAVGSSSASTSCSSRDLSREPLPQASACSSASSVTSMTSLSIGSTTEVLAIGSTAEILAIDSTTEVLALDSAAEVLAIGSSRKTTTSSQFILQRSSSKRPRERIDSSEEQNQPPPRDPTGNNSPRYEVVSSPAAKRHRGWYRIRAREPIARMRDRQLVPQSPRGASRETQRFQQGSLTIGDTCLPLPSRAHQSTQTED